MSFQLFLCFITYQPDDIFFNMTSRQSNFLLRELQQPRIGNSTVTMAGMTCTQHAILAHDEQSTQRVAQSSMDGRHNLEKARYCCQYICYIFQNNIGGQKQQNNYI